MMVCKYAYLTKTKEEKQTLIHKRGPSESHIILKHNKGIM